MPTRRASTCTSPRRYDPDHPLVEDLKRRDLVGFVPIPPGRVTSRGFLEEFAAICSDGAGLNRFLCGALGLLF